MATIHSTTLVPSKLELLRPWMSTQSWYVGPLRPRLEKAGGFRLDDPAGEVGIEVMFINAVGDGEAETYQVPLTYRGAPLIGGDLALVGTATHGVLGDRWIYDGVEDPVFLRQLIRLLCGAARAQDQTRSDMVDERVVVRPVTDHSAAAHARVHRLLGPELPHEG